MDDNVFDDAVGAYAAWRAALGRVLDGAGIGSETDSIVDMRKYRWGIAGGRIIAQRSKPVIPMRVTPPWRIAHDPYVFAKAKTVGGVRVAWNGGTVFLLADALRDDAWAAKMERAR